MPRSNRQFLRLSLRTFLVLFTVLGVWLGYRVNQGRRQKAAIDKVRELGGVIAFEFQRKEGNPDAYDMDAESPRPAWFRELVPSEYYDKVTGVVFPGKSTVRDDDLALFHDLPDVQGVYLIDCDELTGSGFRHFKRLSKLKTLYALGLPLTREGVVYVSEIRQLRALQLSNITNEDVELLSAMHWLNTLHLGGERLDRNWNKVLSEKLPGCDVETRLGAL